MVKITAFDSVDELMELTGKTEKELRGLGFNLDDMDIGFVCNKKLHKTPSKEDVESGDYASDELVADYDLPCHWLMQQMNNYCAGASYVKLGRKHYYTVHHA